MLPIQIAVFLGLVLSSGGAPGSSEAEVLWRFGRFQKVLDEAGASGKPVLVYFWMEGSEQCVQMYEATLKEEAAVEATADFVCYSAKHGDPYGGKLFERYKITTVPCVRVIKPDGEADDGLTGFADPGTFVQQLERIKSGKDTLSDLRARSAADPDDFDLRNRVAGKLFDLGDVEGHDAIRDSIKRDDPEGESRIGAQLHMADVTTAMTKEATRVSEVELDSLYAFAEKARHPDVTFAAWATIAANENARGNTKAEHAALHAAWAAVPAANVLNWGNSTALWLWSNRDVLSKEDRALALDMAVKAVEKAELLRNGGSDGASSYSGDDYEAFLADRLTTLIKCQAMNGKRKDALALVDRCRELDPENPVHERFAKLLKKKKDLGVADAYHDTRPVWSPDGKKVMYTSDRDGNHEIYVADVKKGKERRLTRFRGNESTGSWSPDGKRIAFNSDRFRTSGIYTMKSNGRDVALLVPFDPRAPVGTSDPAWSPDGERIAYASYRNGKSEIAVMNADGTGETILTASTPKTDMQPTWCPKGERIYYMSNRAGDSDVYAITPDGGEDVNVTNAPEDSWDMDPELSPDGKHIVFASWRSGQLEIYVMDPDGKNVENLTNSPTEDRHPRWSPDGKRIAFDRKGADGNTRVFIMNANGSNPVPLVPMS